MAESSTIEWTDAGSEAPIGKLDGSGWGRRRAPHNVLIERQNGSRVVRPFRGLRKPLRSAVGKPAIACWFRQQPGHHSHQRNARWRDVKLGRFVLPIRMSCVEPRVLPDIYGREKPEQQDQAQSHGVEILARAVDADATHREDCGKGQVKQHLARHREYSPAYQSRHVSCRPHREGSAKLLRIDVRDRVLHPDLSRQPLAPADALDIAGAA